MSIDVRKYPDLVQHMIWHYGSEWSGTYTPWGEKIICHLTVKGVLRSATGTDAASAFLGAAMMFGDLRSYLEA